MSQRLNTLGTKDGRFEITHGSFGVFSVGCRGENWGVPVQDEEKNVERATFWLVYMSKGLDGQCSHVKERSDKIR